MHTFPRPVRRALVTGWFSFFHGEATAGDLRAAETVRTWLTEEDVPHDVAMSPVLGGGPTLDEVAPRHYSHLIFVCGPAAGWQVEDLLARFAGCVKVAVGVSVVSATPDGFDVVLPRDAPGVQTPDLSLAAPGRPLPPVVAVVRSHPQNEYADARHADVHEVIDRTLATMDVAVVEVDTRVDPRGLVGRRAGDVEAALAAADAVVSTRMHGLVLALRHGVPGVAVDPVPGGAKVSRQARTLGWPAALTVEELSPQRLHELVTWVLADKARDLALECAERAAKQLDEVRAAFTSVVSCRPVPDR